MTPSEIIGTVANITGASSEDILSRRKQFRVSRARFLAIAAVRHNDDVLTLEETGVIFNRTHGAIIHAMQRHADLLATSEPYLQDAKEIVKELFCKR